MNKQRLIPVLLGGVAPSSEPTSEQGWRAYWPVLDNTYAFSDAGTTPCNNGEGCYQLDDSLGVVASSEFVQATADQRPIYTTGGANGKSYLLFDTANDNMVSLAISNFLAAGAKSIIVVANTYTLITDALALVRDASSYWDVRTRTSPSNSLRFRNYDGTYDESTGGAITLGTPFVYAAKHESGNLYDAINGVSWGAAVASGNTTVMTGLLNLRPNRWHFYALALSNTVLSDAEFAKNVNYFKTQLGI